MIKSSFVILKVMLLVAVLLSYRNAILFPQAPAPHSLIISPRLVKKISGTVKAEENKDFSFKNDTIFDDLKDASENTIEEIYSLPSSNTSSVGLPNANNSSYIIFDAKVDDFNESWKLLSACDFKVKAYINGKDEFEMPLQLIYVEKNKNNKDYWKYAINVKDVCILLKASATDIIGIDFDIASAAKTKYGITTTPITKGYFKYTKCVEFYNEQTSIIPGLHYSLANTYSFNWRSGVFDINPVLIGWGVKWFPFINTDRPDFYFGFSLAGCAAITVNNSGNATEGNSRFTQMTFVPIMVDFNNALTAGLAVVVHFGEVTSYTESLIISISQDLLNFMKQNK
jgi:hypothetical protein